MLIAHLRAVRDRPRASRAASRSAMSVATWSTSMLGMSGSSPCTFTTMVLRPAFLLATSATRSVPQRASEASTAHRSRDRPPRPLLWSRSELLPRLRPHARRRAGRAAGRSASAAARQRTDASRMNDDSSHDRAPFLTSFVSAALSGRFEHDAHLAARLQAADQQARRSPIFERPLHRGHTHTSRTHFSIVKPGALPQSKSRVRAAVLHRPSERRIDAHVPVQGLRNARIYRILLRHQDWRPPKRTPPEAGDRERVRETSSPRSRSDAKKREVSPMPGDRTELAARQRISGRRLRPRAERRRLSVAAAGARREQEHARPRPCTTMASMPARRTSPRNGPAGRQCPLPKSRAPSTTTIFASRPSASAAIRRWRSPGRRRPRGAVARRPDGRFRSRPDSCAARAVLRRPPRQVALRQHAHGRAHAFAGVAAAHDARLPAAGPQAVREPEHQRRLAGAAHGEIADDDDGRRQCSVRSTPRRRASVAAQSVRDTDPSGSSHHAARSPYQFARSRCSIPARISLEHSRDRGAGRR